MDDKTTHSIEKRLYRKIILYDSLLYYLKKERESLISVDLASLWEISREKEEICSEINSLRQEIVALIDEGADYKRFNLNRIIDLIPSGKRRKFQELFHTLTRLKGEIEVLRKENMIFVDDSLNFLDELLSIITGKNGPDIMYDDNCKLSKHGVNIFLSREA